MSDVMKTIIYPVNDIARAKKLFGALLGASPQVDYPNYVGYDSDGLQIGLLPNGRSQGMPTAVCYWDVSDIRKRVKELVDAGGEIHQDTRDVGGGMLVATVKDADGNVIGLRQTA